MFSHFVFQKLQSDAHLPAALQKSYKKAQYVNQVFDRLKELLGIKTFKRLFEVILADNGTEFSNPDRIEYNPTSAAEGKLVHPFYCNPNCS